MLAYAKKIDRTRMLKHIENQGLILRTLKPIPEETFITQSLDTIKDDSVPAADTTIFTSPEDDVKVAVGSKVPLDYATSSGMNNVSQIKEYLCKPQRVATVAWPTTAILNAQLWTVPDTWAIVSAVPTWLEKLRGFYGLRATLCIRLQLNSTPYSAGRLRLAYYPAADANVRKSSIHFENAIPFSQLPGLEMEASDKTKTLKIPYIAPLQFYEMTQNSQSWGRVDLRVVAPYRTGIDNAQTLSIVVWAWLEDVQLFGQTHSGIVTQGVDLPPSQKEEPPFTSFFAHSARAATALTRVPILSAYAGTASWALDALSGICAVFGWSKPRVASIATRQTIGMGLSTANGTGDDMSHSMAVNSDACLSVITDASIRAEDEMSYAFIKKHWSFLQNFEWATTDSVVPTLLYNEFLNPRVDFQNTNVVGLVSLTPIAFLAHHHNLFRGGVEFKIKIAKTAFHSGQFQITYQPGAGIDADLAQSTYLYREIIDLADTNEITFIVPYLQPLEYLDTNISFGRVQIKTLTVLQAPETVNGRIDFSVYVRGADDLQFVQPRLPSLSMFVTQSVDIQTEMTKDLNTVGGAPEQTTFGIDNALRAASEVLLSINMLLKRYSAISPDLVTPTTNFVRFDPYYLTAQSTTTFNRDTDYLSVLLSPYAFFRGSVRMMVAQSDVTTSGYDTMSAFITNNDNGSDSLTELVTRGSTIASTMVNKVNGCFTIQFPYQCVNRMSPIEYCLNPKTTVPSFNAPRGRLVTNFKPNVTQFYRAYGDDFQALFFVGIPELLLTATS